MKREGEKETVIIGAGITGLTTAFYLNRAGRDFLVLEKKERVGGVIQTIRENGFTYETGPNTGVIGQPEAASLFEDIGKEAELEIADPRVKKRYILKEGQWQALPSGLFQAAGTPLFTLKDKFRILAEPFRNKGRNPEETLEQMVLRRMGRSYLDYAVDPFILGVYAGDPATLVPRYALPKLYRLEQRYGSFIGGALKKRFEKKTEEDKKTTRDIFSFKGGLQSLVDALYRQSGSDNFRLGVREVKLDRQEGGYRISFAGPDGHQEYCHAGNVVVTSGINELPGLLPFVAPGRMKQLTHMRYAKVIEVALGFKRWEGMKPDGFGGLIPFKEKRDILGILFISSFLPGRAPLKGALFTIFIGGLRRPDLFERSDDEIVTIIRREFKDLMGVEKFSPDLLKIFRYEWAIPQYEQSSGRRFELIKEIEREMPGLKLRGNFTGGIGLADRIRQGKQTASALIH